jgi:hypothetical protein
MEGVLPILAIWALLCVALVGYVIYRFLTDRARGASRHPLFPLVSRSSDPAFPTQGAWLAWASYTFLLAVPCGLLGALASEVGLISAPWSGTIAGVGLLLGLSFLALARLIGKRK